MSVTLFWTVLLGSLALDQGLKAWTRGKLHEGQSLDLPWPGIFEIKRVTNEGIAFGLFQGLARLLTPIAIVIALFAIAYSFRNRKESLWMHAAMAFLAAGALGNLYDRIFLTGVTDMFWFRAINFPVFNAADIWITIATAILLLRWSVEAIWHKPAPAQSLWPSPEAKVRTTGAAPEREADPANLDPEVLSGETKSYAPQSLSMKADGQVENRIEGPLIG